MSAIEYVFKYINLISLSDIIDMAIVAVLIYNLIKWLRETRAMQLVKGIMLVFVIMMISDLANLTMLNYVINTLVQVGMFAIVVLFQPELRSILEKLGRSSFGRIMDFTKDKAKSKQHNICDEIVTAVMNMAASRTGALIVIERETKLGEIKTGTTIDAEISSQLLENIFVPNTPLHDGAVIIRGNRILSAASFLPLTSNTNVSKELGTRHRAALGISEVSDALTIVISEETGKVSLALNGTLTRNVGKEPLHKALEKVLASDIESSMPLDRILFWKGASKNEKKRKK